MAKGVGQGFRPSRGTPEMSSHSISSQKKVLSLVLELVKFSNHFCLSSELEKGPTPVIMPNPQNNPGDRWCYLHCTGEKLRLS